MRYVGTKSSASRIANFKSKIRQFTGTGSAPDYIAPVALHKLAGMSRRHSPALGD